MTRLRIHPLKEGSNAALAEVLVPLIDGSIESFLHAHGKKLPRDVRGLLKGSLRKRILNQMLAEEDRLRTAVTVQSDSAQLAGEESDTCCARAYSRANAPVAGPDGAPGAGRGSPGAGSLDRLVGIEQQRKGLTP